MTDARNDSVQARLAHDNAHFDLAERAARFGYWRAELKDGSTYWSPGMYRLLSVDPSVPPDSDWLLEQMMPEDKLVVQDAIANAIKTRTPFTYRTRARDPNVAAQIVDTQGELAIGPDGRVVAVIGVCYDVTRQVKAEEARERAQRMYRLMTEEASDIIILYGEDGRVLFASQALERVLGYTVADIEGDRVLPLIHPDDVGEILRIWERPAAGHTLTATYRMKHAAGHYVWIEVMTRAVGDAESGGGQRNTVCTARDVTSRREQEIEAEAARERAEAANKAKSRFLANMSHELRTPLNAVIGFTDLMRQEMFGKLGNERYEEYTTLIYDSGQLLLDLITDMLDMAKIEAGKLELNFERVDLTGTIEDSVRMLTDRADSGGLDIAVSLPKEPISLIADRRAVKQVLLNLLTNAIKFTPPGGRIQIAVRIDNGTATLSVRDTGIGIPAHELPRLGRPFEQVCGDPMLAKSGAGLGLALVRALVEKHGGRMRIESEEGVGTEVSVDFPLNPAQRAAA
jgi:PAS domain S-box-containing protein